MGWFFLKLLKRLYFLLMDFLLVSLNCLAIDIYQVHRLKESSNFSESAKEYKPVPANKTRPFLAKHGFIFILTLGLFSICLFLSNWQYEKGLLVQEQDKKNQRVMAEAPINFEEWIKEKNTDLDNAGSSVASFRIAAEGEFDPSKIILLENKILNGQVGYEVFQRWQPNLVDFSSLNSDDELAYSQSSRKNLEGIELENTDFWVNRGWIKALPDRSQLPVIAHIPGTQSIELLQQSPSNPMPLQSIIEKAWPQRVQYLDETKVKEIYRQNNMAIKNIIFFKLSNPIGDLPLMQNALNGNKASKHFGYAFQWIMIGLALLIFSIFKVYREYRK